MTNQTKIKATYAEVPFDQTYISDINPRRVVIQSSIEALAENIRECELIHNLAGLADADGKVGIVAGGRRHRALALLQDDPRFQTVTVKMAPDETTARAWASAENANREQLHPADEIRDYGDMEKRGLPVASIAVAFGVTEKHVYRRLKLASLPVAVIDALRNDEISLSNAAAFTVSDDEKLSLEVLERVRGDSYSDHQIKQLLKPDSIKGTDRRALFVGRDAYEAAGGRMVGDLFTEQTYFDDPALLADLFQQNLDAAAAALTVDGWKWAEAITSAHLGYYDIEDRKLSRMYPTGETLTEAEVERYDELGDLANGDALDDEGQIELEALEKKAEGTFGEDEKALSGVICYINSEGRLTAQEGLVKTADKAAAQAAGFLEKSHHGSATDAEPKSPISQKLRDDLNRVVTGARQHAALRDPEMVLALLAYQLTGKAGFWDQPFGIRCDDVPNWPTTEAEGYALDERLTTPATTNGDPYKRIDQARSFRAYKGKGMEKIMEDLHRHLAALMKPSEALAGVVDKTVDTSIREVWTPTAENFFSRVGGPYLNQLWADLLELAADHPTVTTFAKLKKGEKADKLGNLFGDEATRSALGLTDEQQARIAAWLPEDMG